MQQSVFTTEVPNKTPKPNIRDLIDKDNNFTNYVESLNQKIGKGIQVANFNLNIKRRQMMDQVKEIRDKQQALLDNLKVRQNYFEQHYYKFLRHDIKKFTQYNVFFNSQFDMLNDQIEMRKLKKKSLQIKMTNLKTELMEILKENRKMQQNIVMNGSRVSTKKRLSIRQSLDVKPHAKYTESTEVSLRIVTEPNKGQKSMSTSRVLPKLNPHYMEPVLRSSRKLITQDDYKPIQLLIELLEFRNNDSQNKQWSWIEELIFKPRHYVRLMEHLNQKLEYMRAV